MEENSGIENRRRGRAAPIPFRRQTKRFVDCTLLNERENFAVYRIANERAAEKTRSSRQKWEYRRKRHN